MMAIVQLGEAHGGAAIPLCNAGAQRAGASPNFGVLSGDIIERGNDCAPISDNVDKSAIWKIARDLVDMIKVHRCFFDPYRFVLLRRPDIQLFGKLLNH